jgi:hypothetical protein
LSESKEAVTRFLYAEKIKSDLILTAGLLQVLKEMTDEEIIGAEKLLISYLNALIKEVGMAENISGVQKYHEVGAKIEEVIEQAKQRKYVNAVKLVSEAISLTTTSGHQAAQALKEKGLI